MAATTTTSAQEVELARRRACLRRVRLLQPRGRRPPGPGAAGRPSVARQAVVPASGSARLSRPDESLRVARALGVDRGRRSLRRASSSYWPHPQRRPRTGSTRRFAGGGPTARHDTVLIALTGGSSAGTTTCGDFERVAPFPPGLRDWSPREPLWVDLRWARDERDVSMRNPRFRDSVGDLAAPTARPAEGRADR